MKGRELNKFATCHMSFGPMNIPQTHENRLKMKKFLPFGDIFPIRFNRRTWRVTPPKTVNLTFYDLKIKMKILGLL